jgi:RNA polymerase sigma-70 factor (ECF subfamily)
VGNRADAEEVLQEVFLQAWRSAARYDPSRGSPEAWLIMMARSRAIDAVRATRRAPDRLDAEPVSDALGSMPDVAGGVEARTLVSSALADLTAAQREVLELAFYDGLSQAEIAVKTGTPLGTVKTRTRMALERLRQTFAMKGWIR